MTTTDTQSAAPVPGVGCGALLGVARALRNQLAIFAKDYSGPVASLLEESGHTMEQLIAKLEGDYRRCRICGFAVDVSKEAITPEIAFPMQGRTRGVRDEPEDTTRAGGPPSYHGTKVFQREQDHANADHAAMSSPNIKAQPAGGNPA